MSVLKNVTDCKHRHNLSWPDMIILKVLFINVERIYSYIINSNVTMSGRHSLFTGVDLGFSFGE